MQSGYLTVGVCVHLARMNTVMSVLEAEGVEAPKVLKPLFEKIECPRCRTVNDPTAAYCMKCSALPIVGVMLASR